MLVTSFANIFSHSEGLVLQFSPFVDGYFGRFHVLAIINSAAVNIGCMCLFELVFSFFFLDIYPGVELLGHWAVLFLAF